jgi:hypothetical protein
MAAQPFCRLYRWNESGLEQNFTKKAECDSPAGLLLWLFCGAITGFPFQHGGEEGGNQE